MNLKLVHMNDRIVKIINHAKIYKVIQNHLDEKIHFSICFVHKMKKIITFGLTFGRKRSRNSVTGGSIFTNLVSKYPQD